MNKIVRECEYIFFSCNSKFSDVNQHKRMNLLATMTCLQSKQGDTFIHYIVQLKQKTQWAKTFLHQKKKKKNRATHNEAFLIRL